MDLGAPLAGLLSDGHLVAQDASELSIWTEQGDRLTSTPAGDIHFIQELSTAAGEVCVLTRCLEFAGQGNPTVTIQSWELPLSEFLGL